MRTQSKDTWHETSNTLKIKMTSIRPEKIEIFLGAQLQKGNARCAQLLAGDVLSSVGGCSLGTQLQKMDAKPGAAQLQNVNTSVFRCDGPCRCRALRTALMPLRKKKLEPWRKEVGRSLHSRFAKGLEARAKGLPDSH